MWFDDLNAEEEMQMAIEADELEKSLIDKDGKESDDETKKESQSKFASKGAFPDSFGKKYEGFSLVHTKGDLFTCPQTDSLAHCVSKDLRMGKGIAVLFRKKFGGLSELHPQANRVGDVAVLERDGRFIYYLITKPKYNNKPRYEDLETTLQGMKHHCLKHGVTRLSMPRIGCGLDKLEWTQVESRLIKVFGEMNMTITIYSI